MATHPSTQEKRRAPHPRELVGEVVITDFLSPQDYLGRIYQLTKERSFGYSYMDFAEDLGFSRSNVMRLMIVGQRPLTLKSAERIVDALNLSGVDKKYFLILAKHGTSRVSHERDLLFEELVALKTKKRPKELSPAQAEYFSEWYHPVIREMTGLPHFSGDPAWIQEQLNFSLRIDQIKKSLELLGQLGFICFNKETGQWQKSADDIVTDDEVDSLALIRYHQKMIEMGKESIVEINEDQREIRAATLSIPAHLMPILKTKIAAWVHELITFEKSYQVQPNMTTPDPNQSTLQTKKPDQVVQVNVQLFAFTKGSVKGQGGDA